MLLKRVAHLFCYKSPQCSHLHGLFRMLPSDLNLLLCILGLFIKLLLVVVFVLFDYLTVKLNTVFYLLFHLAQVSDHLIQVLIVLLLSHVKCLFRFGT